MKGSDVQEAREDPGRPDRKAYIQQKSVYRIQQKPRGRQGGLGSETRQGGFHGKAPTKPWWNSETWGRPRARDKQRDCFAWMATAQQQCKRRRRWDTGGLTANNNHAGGVEDLRNHAVVESQRPKRERAQTADRVVVKYLDRRARAPTVNRRPRSGVGGARRGVREYGAVNYHKVELKEQRKTKQFSSVVVAWKRVTTQSRRALETQSVWCAWTGRAARGRACGGAATPWSEHSSN